jgi:hypothetical protein
MSFLDSSLALYSIPLAWVTTVYPTFMRVSAVEKYLPYDNIQPRHNIARLEKKGVPPDVIARIQRMSDANLVSRIPSANKVYCRLNT